MMSKYIGLLILAECAYSLLSYTALFQGGLLPSQDNTTIWWLSCVMSQDGENCSQAVTVWECSEKLPGERHKGRLLRGISYAL